MAYEECILPESLGLLPGLRLLHCLDCHGIFLPANLGWLSTLQDLSLDSYIVNDLVPRFGDYFSSLTRLNLKCFKCCLPALLSGLPALRSLSLEICTLQGEGTLKHSKLRELYLDHCHATVPFYASGLRALRSLKANSRGAVFLSPSLRPENQRHLETLSITSEDSLDAESFLGEEAFGRYLPPSMGFCFRRLTRLILDGLSLEALSDSLCSLSSLQELSLTYLFDLTNLPAAMGGVCCPGCSAGVGGLTGPCLPGCVPGLVGLRKLRLDCLLKLGSLPTSMGKLKALEVLKITYCDKVSNVSEVLSNLEGLRVLDVDTVNLRMQGAKSLSLRVLELSDCPPSRDPTEMPPLLDLANLQVLTFRDCRLKDLGTAILSLSRLTELRVVDCKKLAALPAELGVLQRLQKLDLRSLKALSSLPESVGALHGLEALVLVSLPALKALPLSLGGLTGLRIMVVENCPALPLRGSSRDGLILLENFPRLQTCSRGPSKERFVFRF